MIDVVRQVAFHQNIAREELAFRVHLAAAAHLDDLLGGDENFLELVQQPALGRIFADGARDLVLEVRIGVNDIPAHGHGSVSSVSARVKEGR